MASEEQKKIMDWFTGHTGFDFRDRKLVKHDDHKGFLKIYDENIEFANDVVNEASCFINKYYTKHMY